MKKKNVIVYIDGFNFFYGSIKGTQYKWLNFQSLMEKIIPSDFNILKIRYFTARVNGNNKAKNQSTYIEALKTLDNFKIYEGSFQSNIVPVNIIPEGYSNKKAFEDRKKNEWKEERIIKTVEKGSDVNLASHMLLDTFNNFHDGVVIVTNDSDFFTPLKMIKNQFKKHIMLISPYKNKSSQLCKLTKHIKNIKKSDLETSQFPNTLVTKEGKKIKKPSEW